MPAAEASAFEQVAEESRPSLSPSAAPCRRMPWPRTPVAERAMPRKIAINGSDPPKQISG
ncbi:hypothetical protein GCM10010307_69420 [Streptomyces vastus]|uniref:Uncharacterized protein n=1 Tax=Streptomyces vastus TaxID=285451 RepID=A0ABP6DZB1_9ACTN